MILLLRIQRKAYFSYYFDSPLTMILIQKPQLYIQDAMAWLKIAIVNSVAMNIGVHVFCLFICF